MEHIIVALRGEDYHAPGGANDNEVAIFQPGSKNDWLGQGTSRNIYEDPDNSPLCVVRLFNLLREIDEATFLERSWHTVVYVDLRPCHSQGPC